MLRSARRGPDQDGRRDRERRVGGGTMSTSSARNFGKVLGITLFLAAFMVGGSVAQLTAAESTTTDANVLEGVVTSTNGPEAGVWVIAETTDLPTKFAKIVV